MDTVSPATSVKLEVPSKSVVVPGPDVVICTSGFVVKPKYGGKLVALNCGDVGLTTVPVTWLKRSATPLAVAVAKALLPSVGVKPETEMATVCPG
jgi:repressor of nif and glnA expression